jgi:plastocyanin
MLNDLWTQVLGWSSALVTPDWGELIALIPLLLLLVVAAFLAITGTKWAAVGPSSAGERQRLPLTPDGHSLLSPVVGPLLLAAGVFLFAFGLLAGGAWLLAGIVTAVVAVSVWAVQVRAAPTRSLPRLSRGRLGVIAGVGVVAAVLVATARVEPDRPGKPAGVAAPGVGAQSSAGSGLASSGAPSALPSADAAVTARGIVYLEPMVAAPAGRPFTVAFDNLDSVPHNLEIRDASGTVVFRGDIVTGPVVKVYEVPTLAAGTYQFICTVHPAMTGVLTAK